MEDIAFVKLGDIGDFVLECPLTLNILLMCKTWKYAVWFNRKQLELVEGQTNESSDLIIYKSRWDEIIENLSKPLNCMTDEEVEIVKSVLKNNTPFYVVPNLVDPVISKEVQTHLDATHIGDTGHFALYYKSTLLNKLFYWNSTSWVGSGFNYEDDGDLIPVSFGIVIGESK